MWKYTDVTREEFEIKKDRVEEMIVSFGAVPVNDVLFHKVSCFSGGITDSILSARRVYEYKKQYVRVCEVLFPEKPFIVIEWAENIEQVIDNQMEDTDPFPYDLPDDEIVKEIEWILK